MSSMARWASDFPRFDLGVPTSYHLFEAGDVHLPVMKERIELGHVGADKATILSDRITGERRGARVHPFGQEGERLTLCLRQADLALAHPLGES